MSGCKFLVQLQVEWFLGNEPLMHCNCLLFDPNVLLSKFFELILARDNFLSHGLKLFLLGASQELSFQLHNVVVLLLHWVVETSVLLLHEFHLCNVPAYFFSLSSQFFNVVAILFELSNFDAIINFSVLLRHPLLSAELIESSISCLGFIIYQVLRATLLALYMSRKAGFKKEVKPIRNSLEIRRPQASLTIDDSARDRNRGLLQQLHGCATYAVNSRNNDGELSAGVTAQLKSCVR